MLWPVVKSLLGHYRRHPIQMLLVWLGLTLGVSVLVGVLAISQHAKTSYQSGKKLFTDPFTYRIQPKDTTNKIPQGFYVHLRRQGFVQCIPADLKRVYTSKGVELHIVGTDPLAFINTKASPRLENTTALQLIKQPNPVLVNSSFANYMNWQEGQMLTLSNGIKIGPLIFDNDEFIKGANLLVDLAKLRQFSSNTGFSFIACGDMSLQETEKLRKTLPKGIQITKTTRSELASLTEAFHINLTALGMLSFMVGLFIFYQAMSLSLVQRQPIVGILRQTGVSGWQLAIAFSIELCFLVCASWGVGNIFGLWLANQLVPSVALGFGVIYNTTLDMKIPWSWQWSSISLLMVGGGVALSSIWPLIRLMYSQPIRLSERLSVVRFTKKEFFWQAILAAICMVIGLIVYYTPQNSYTGYTVIAMMLLGVALVIPFILFIIFQWLSYRLKWVKARLFFSDAVASMSYRGLALMAFMLAMSANIGVETVVGSFRSTTESWLTQRLAAEIFVQPTKESADRMVAWLEQQPEVNNVWHRWETELLSLKGGLSVNSTGTSNKEQQAYSIKVSIPDYWQQLHRHRSVMISESMALKKGYQVGDHIDLPQPLGKGWHVVGIFYDYGNPFDLVSLSHEQWQKTFKGNGFISLGIDLKQEEDRDSLITKIINRYHLPHERVINNKLIYKQALLAFDQTFVIADSLGDITLVIAVLGLFLSTLGGEISRQRNTTLMRCLGISTKELFILGGLQLFLLGLVTALIAVPLGLALANCVVELVLKFSFGWTMELDVIPWVYLKTVGWALLTLMLAGMYPVWLVVMRTPIKSLRDAL